MSNLRGRGMRTMLVSGAVFVICIPLTYASAHLWSNAWVLVAIFGWAMVLGLLGLLVGFVIWLVGWSKSRSSSGSAARSTSEELERVTALHAAGSLSDEEFAAAKAKLLQ